MTLQRLVSVLIAVLAATPGARSDEPSLAPVGALAGEIAKGLAPFLAGEEPLASWTAVKASAKSKEALQAIRAATQGATAGTVYGLDLSLVWEKEGQVVYQVDVALFFGADAPGVVSVAGKSAAGPPAAGFTPIGRMVGADRSIGAAAAFLAAALAEGSPIPYATGETMGKLLRGDALTKARAGLEKAPRNASMIKAILDAREPDGCRVRTGALRFSVLEGEAPRGLLSGTLGVAGDTLTLSLDSFDEAQTAWVSWYPRDVTPPKGTQYPCAFTALPKDLAGIEDRDRHYLDHACALIVKAIHAKLVVLNALGQPKGPYEGAARSYHTAVQGALEKLQAEPVPVGLETFHGDLTAAFELQLGFFKDAAVARKAGQSWDQMMAIPSGRGASQRLLAAWGNLQRRYPRWSPEVKDSLYHHLCALDLF